MAKQNWTLDQIINQLDSGYKWNVAPSGTITWGTPSTNSYYDDEYFGNDEIYGLQKLNATQTAVAARSLSLWSDVANINFVRVGTDQSADITFQNSTEMGDGYAWAYYPTDENNSMKGSVWFNSYYSGLQKPSLNGDAASWGNLAFIHEIGHALGLEHMGNYDAGDGETITYKTHASCAEDSLLYSIMSYFAPDETKQADWRASDGKMYFCQTPMMNDIAAIQKIYGKKATRESDTVYGFNASSGLNSVYNFSINKHPVLCIYDTNGIDTLNLSGFSSNSSVNLQPGTFSSCDKMTKNISIARDVIIENATTGAGNDSISGNSADNILISNAGADVLNGLEGNDRLFGGAGNDRLYGGTGNDTLNGGSGNDRYLVDSSDDRILEIAKGGTDTVESTVSITLEIIGAQVENIILSGTAKDAQGNSLNNTITGNAQDNVLSGGAGNDRLYGGSGNDTLDGGRGNDAMTGGAGDDIYIFNSTRDSAVETAGGGNDTITSYVSITLARYVENVILAGSSALNATGNGSSNRLIGNDAANALNGGSNDDALFGGNGNDWLDGGSGSDEMDGGNGNDTYVVDSLTDLITETGTDTDTVIAGISFTLDANLENLTLIGSAQSGTGNDLNNTIIGTTGANSLFGGNGNDWLDGGSGNDQMDGGNGNDTYVVDSRSDVITETGTDTDTDNVIAGISFTLGTNLENLTLTGSAKSGKGNELNNTIIGTKGSNYLFGGEGNDQLFGGSGNDTLDGGSGNDTLDGGRGNDAMTGGVGDDMYIFNSTRDSTVETAGGGNDTVTAYVSITLAQNVENVILAGSSALNATGNAEINRLEGNDAANVLNGGSNDDSLFGGNGDDWLDGGSGNDQMDGGNGNDTYVVDSLTDVITETGTGIDTVIAGMDFTLGANLENLTLIGSAQSGTGNGLNNTIIGTTGSNSLFGDSGNDWLDGGSGSDEMEGGNGNDTYVVDSLADVITETGTDTDIDTVIASVSFTLGANLENLTLTGSTKSGTGNDLNNTIIGTTGSNQLYGGAGDDTLNGGAGADQLFGGAGNDIFVLDNASDRIIEISGAGTNVNEGIDTARASVTVTTSMIGVNVENIQLTGTAAISATGNALANEITGNAGANTLDGAAGDDILNGGAGNDRLFGGADNDILNGGSGKDLLDGGAGADIFVFNTALGRSNIDTIQNFAAGEDRIHLESDIFTGLSSGLAGALGTLLIYNRSTGALSYDADGSGTASAAIQFATLSKNLTLTADNFAII